MWLAWSFGFRVEGFSLELILSWEDGDDDDEDDDDDDDDDADADADSDRRCDLAGFFPFSGCSNPTPSPPMVTCYKKLALVSSFQYIADGC